MTHDEIKALSTQALKSIIATTNPGGRFARELAWAKRELERRGVDYADCLA
jgi:hypothetical protein